MSIDPGTNLYFESSGPSGGNSIVFLHGGGLAGWMWREQVKAFQGEYYVLVPDLPEQGHNTNNNSGPYTTESAANKIAAFINNQAHGGKAHVVGLSEGAQVLVALLSKHAEVLDHAVVSSAILRPMWATKLSGSMVGWSYRWFMAPFKNSDWWIRLNMKGQTGLSEEYFSDFKESFQTTTEASLVHMMESAMAYRMPAGMEKVNVPTLVVCGKKEYKEMKESVRDLAAALPNSRAALISLGKGASLAKEHGWAFTAPMLFNAAVKAWIEDQPLPTELLSFS